MSDGIKAGLKPAPILPKGAIVGKSPKDFPGLKKLPGTIPAKPGLKQDGPPQLKPPIAPKGEVLKSGAIEPKSQIPKKQTIGIKPDAVKKVGIDAPKMGPPSKDGLSMKKTPPVMMAKKMEPPSKVTIAEKAGVVKSTAAPPSTLKSEIKPAPPVKSQDPVANLPPSSGTKAEPKLEVPNSVPPPKSSEPKAKLVPQKESQSKAPVVNKPQTPEPAKSHVQATPEPSLSKTSVSPVKTSMGINQNSPQSGMPPQIGGGVSAVPNVFDRSMSPNFQGLDPAIWQMVTTIAAICSAACQNGGRSKSRHCCRKHRSRKHRKEAENVDIDSNNSNKDSSDQNVTSEDQASKEDGDGVAKKTGEKKSTQNDNTVSGTKWHGIEKKIATIRGLRDLEDSDSNIDDDELAASDALVQGIGQPRYSDVIEFPSEISTFNASSKTRRYLAKQGVCTGPKYSKSPFVGGLSAARRRPYSSLTEMAAYFSNIEPQDQNDVIVMLLACRKLEKQIEEQQVVMQLLEHDLKEAQSLLRFPPEWRSLNNNEVLGHPPLPTGQIPSTNDPPYVSNHPNVEPPWVNKRPKDGLPSRAPTKL
ncbi:hypothetical protein OIY81_2771 [Cryptosporidium canis]|nr:hypothetical protein OIY81_2771 [Cryptosporidium canis]